MEAGAQIGAPSGEQVQAEVSTPQAVASFESYKNADGSYDMERVWKDLTAERERADGLRKKLTDSAAKKPEASRGIFSRFWRQREAPLLCSNGKAKIQRN
ncbi:MAG: hypothetical protein LBJ94_01775 [Puniceicoccales bacterium]|nr:hypothetical protein [Puniceicoccales bacterium]